MVSILVCSEQDVVIVAANDQLKLSGFGISWFYE
ncbi:hypothetical protein RSK20926_15837 [Roseobacter sp. SK209-2-6]|nr:hypothetical protein RSK20926_15837 [Roseobacter sp. SK209-2-6]